MPNSSIIWKRIARVCATAVFVTAGVQHFRSIDFFTRIVPPQLPNPKALVIISGLAEIAGGLAIWFKPLRRPAAWGLIVLLIAVFPANVFMARHPEATPEMHVRPWVLWARLPLQLPLIALVWFAGLRRPREVVVQDPV